MHVGRVDEQAQDPVETGGEFDVGVFEDVLEKSRGLRGEDGERRRRKHGDHCEITGLR